MIAVLTASVIGLELVKPVGAAAPGARAAIETMISLSAMLTAWLLVRVFRATHRLLDLVLLCALAAVYVSDLVFYAAPSLGGAVGPESRGDAQLACDLLIAIAFAAAALVPQQTVRGDARRLVALACAVGAGSVALAPLFSALGGTHWGANVLRSTGIPGAGDHPVAVAVQLVAGVVMFGAGLVFVLRGARGDVRAGLLGGALFLFAGARLQYLAMPNVASDWVTPREGLRLCGYALLLASVYGVYANARHRQTDAAVMAERERIARDLHDGLAQDLAYITVQSQRLGSELGPEHPLLVAARRALAGARGAIADLTASDAPSTETALRRIGDELGHRFGLTVDVSVDRHGSPKSDDLESCDREHLVRIAREAIVNAALHGAARHVEVLLDYWGTALRLRISDDGCGIADADRVGFGLQTMRARARALGGRLHREPGDDGGTVLELLVSERRASPAARPTRRRPQLVVSGAQPVAARPMYRRFAWAGRRQHVGQRSA